MAQQYIDKGPAGGNVAMGEFDAFAEDIGMRISSITKQTAEKASRMAHVNKGIQKITDLKRSLLNLMLAAMDSIIDRNSRTIEEERFKAITAESKLLENASVSLQEYCNTAVLGDCVTQRSTIAPKLTYQIKMHLKKTIEKSTVEY